MSIKGLRFGMFGDVVTVGIANKYHGRYQKNNHVAHAEGPRSDGPSMNAKFEVKFTRFACRRCLYCRRPD